MLNSVCTKKRMNKKGSFLTDFFSIILGIAFYGFCFFILYLILNKWGNLSFGDFKINLASGRPLNIPYWEGLGPKIESFLQFSIYGDSSGSLTIPLVVTFIILFIILGICFSDIFSYSFDEKNAKIIGWGFAIIGVVTGIVSKLISLFGLTSQIGAVGLVSLILFSLIVGILSEVFGFKKILLKLKTIRELKQIDKDAERMKIKMNNITKTMEALQQALRGTELQRMIEL